MQAEYFPSSHPVNRLHTHCAYMRRTATLLPDMSLTGLQGCRPDSQWWPAHREIVSPGSALDIASLIQVYVWGSRTRVPDLTWSLAPDSTENTRRRKEWSVEASLHLEHTPTSSRHDTVEHTAAGDQADRVRSGWGKDMEQEGEGDLEVYVVSSRCNKNCCCWSVCVG